MEKPIEDLYAAISRGDLNYEELTAFYLNRIKRTVPAKRESTRWRRSTLRL